MSNAPYPLGLDALLTGGVDLDTDTIKAVLVKNDYTFSTAHQYLSSISSGSRLATSTLASITVTSGVVDAADFTFSAVAAAGTANAVAVYKDTGSAATSPLLFYFDTATSGLPYITNGGDANIAWSNGANKVVKFG